MASLAVRKSSVVSVAAPGSSQKPQCTFFPKISAMTGFRSAGQLVRQLVENRGGRRSGACSWSWNGPARIRCPGPGGNAGGRTAERV
jgi:hypothetical protein